MNATHVNLCCVVAAQVKMPSGVVDEPIIEDNFDGTIRVQYNPKEDGVHEMILMHDGKPIQGTYILILIFICTQCLQQ